MYNIETVNYKYNIRITFQPFLRFWSAGPYGNSFNYAMFQPFLRFYHSCGWLLWVFKFFFGFLSSRRSA